MAAILSRILNVIDRILLTHHVSQVDATAILLVPLRVFIVLRYDLVDLNFEARCATDKAISIS